MSLLGIISTILILTANIFFGAGNISRGWEEFFSASPEIRQEASLPAENEAESSLPEETLEITAKSAIAIDVESGQAIYEKNPDESLPIASLTKLMTTMVFLDTVPDGGRTVTIGREDEAPGAGIAMSPGDEIKIGDLFYAGLVGSANNAIRALVRSSGLTEEEFVGLMNRKAEDLGLEDTSFVEITGLNPSNRSTARDVAAIAKYAFREKSVREATLTERYSFLTQNTKKTISAENTDKLLKDGDFTGGIEIVGGKTGYLDEAGYCLAIEARRKDDGREIIAVLLGAESDAKRFGEMKEIIIKAFESHGQQAN